VSVRIDDVEMPLGFRQLQAASLIEWAGNIDDAEFQLLTRRLMTLSPLESGRLPLPEPPRERLALPREPELRIPLPSEGTAAGIARRHPWVEPTLLLAAVFLVNYVETSVDAALTPARLGADAGYPVADAFRWFEGGLSFELHDTVGALAYYGYSASYFVIFPVLCLYAAWVLARRKDPRPYQALGLGVALDYLISLPFFVFFPVPERWSSPDTEAMLLSDKVSDRLIELVRPVSGLDNCFPSFHVSLTVLVVAACFMFRVPMRVLAAALGTTIVLSTFVLGVHWLPDMLAGLALGIVSLLLAWRIVRRRRSPFLVKALAEPGRLEPAYGSASA
jgi:membrane-associated phospholipid phosphatase